MFALTAGLLTIEQALAAVLARVQRLPSEAVPLEDAKRVGHDLLRDPGEAGEER